MREGLGLLEGPLVSQPSPSHLLRDLPHGYQVTQQRWPLASNGSVTFMPHIQQTPKKKNKKRRRASSVDSTDAKTQNEESKEHFEPKPVELRIERVQLEQDTGKTTTHASTGENGQPITISNIDYNRAGCALIEIVSCPDLRSAHEAAGAVERIRRLLKHIGSCDGRMEEGSLRCDLNVSIAPLTKSESLPRYELPPGNGQRVEVKNLNSLRQIIAATEFEALRQSRLVLHNNPTGRETRAFHVKPVSESYPLGGETFCIRAKGDAVDYRFMPEPDLPPLILDKETLGSDLSLQQYILSNMPEMPEEAAARIRSVYGLSEDIAGIISNDPPAVGFFEEAVSSARLEIADGVDPASIPTLVANWLCNDLYALVRRKVLESKNHPEEDSTPDDITVELSSVDGNRLGQLVALIANETLTSSMAKRVLNKMFNEGSTSSPSEIATANGWRVIKDMDTLVKLCQSVVFDPQNASQLQQFKDGKKTWKIEKFFIGKIMAASKGNAHPELLKEALKTALSAVE